MTKRATIYVLCIALFNAVLLSACAPSNAARESPAQQQRAAYIEELRQKPPQELTAAERDYLRLVAQEEQAAAQEEQASDLEAIKALQIMGVVSITVLGIMGLISIADLRAKTLDQNKAP